MVLARWWSLAGLGDTRLDQDFCVLTGDEDQTCASLIANRDPAAGSLNMAAAMARGETRGCHKDQRDQNAERTGPDH